MCKTNVTIVMLMLMMTFIHLLFHFVHSKALDTPFSELQLGTWDTARDQTVPDSWRFRI